MQTKKSRIKHDCKVLYQTAKKEESAVKKTLPKVLQIGYEPEKDRLTWDGWDIHCGQSMDVLLPDQLGSGTWRAVSFECNDEGWYIPTYPDVSPVGLWSKEIDC